MSAQCNNDFAITNPFSLVTEVAVGIVVHKGVQIIYVNTGGIGLPDSQVLLQVGKIWPTAGTNST